LQVCLCNAENISRSLPKTSKIKTVWKYENTYCNARVWNLSLHLEGRIRITVSVWRKIAKENTWNLEGGVNERLEKIISRQTLSGWRNQEVKTYRTLSNEKWIQNSSRKTGRGMTISETRPRQHILKYVYKRINSVAVWSGVIWFTGIRSNEQ
jgi:hypothetical protein